MAKLLRSNDLLHNITEICREISWWCLVTAAAAMIGGILVAPIAIFSSHMAGPILLEGACIGMACAAAVSMYFMALTVVGIFAQNGRKMLRSRKGA